MSSLVSRDMRTHRLTLLGAVVVVVAAVSGGCGGSGGGTNAASTAASTGSSSSSGGAVIKTVSVHETEYKLSPNTISLSKAGTYVFKGVNDGTTTHGLAVDGHKALGMKGEVTVGGSGAPGGGTSTMNTNTGSSGTTTYSTGY